MLGLVIEKVTGDSLAKAYSKYIFEPAQMKDTQLQTDASVLAGLVPSYRYNFIEAKYDSSEIRHPSSTFSTGGLVSSARDLTKWLKFVQQNKAYFDSSTDKGRGQGAMGWRVGLPGIKEADAYVWHGGLVTGYRSQITQSRDGKQRVVVLSNQRDAETMEISADILNILNGKDDVIVSKSLTKEVLQVSYHKGNQAAVERFLEIVNKDTGEFSKDDTQVLIAAMELKSDGACDRALPLIDAWKRVYKGSNYYGFADKLSSQCRSTN